MATKKRKRWSKHVTEKSNALDLEQGVFSKDDPRSVARSLKRSADRSRRRKADPFSLRDVDAYFLHKSRGKDAFQIQTEPA